MIVAAHQPHYLPWAGYLHKVARADVFVVMDDLQYETQNFQNRNRVKVNNGPTWLTVPLVKGAQSDRICDRAIHNGGSAREHWARRSWLTLKTHYHRAPFFEDFAPELEAAYARTWTRLLDLNLHMLKLMLRWLRIETPIVMASTLRLDGQKSDRILHMCRRVGATGYLSGAGGSASYLDMDLFEQASVEVKWQRFHHPVYDQRYPEHGFISHLAALDMLFNCGAERSRALLESADGVDEIRPMAAMAAGGVA